MDLSEQAIRSRLSGALIGRQIHYFHELDSTNTCAAQLADGGAAEGEVVIADRQTRGRGRMDRLWHSPPGRNIFTSIILRPQMAPATASVITLTAGVAVADAIASICPGRIRLKWPNDVLIGGRKACGILTEMKTRGKVIDCVIVGIGINVNMERGDFPEELQRTATSLREEAAETVSRQDVAVHLYRSFESWYQILMTKGFEGVRTKWMRYANLMGRDIEVKQKQVTQRGRIVGLDDRGALILCDADSRRRRVLSGDITVIGDEICC